LKKKDEEKYDIIISICHLKKYLSNNIIINYENVLDKMYFLLEGKISVYKPIFISKLMTQEKFIRLLSLFNNKENINKYNRIQDKNKITISEFNYNNKRKLQNFFIEQNKKSGGIEEGQDFGGKIEDIEDILADVDQALDKI
jgi:signal-transduction protein with cAMP-binding, CBS, and nucleotidyltransferase domain